MRLAGEVEGVRDITEFAIFPVPDFLFFVFDL
jgi:hypothetical protein